MVYPEDEQISRVGVFEYAEEIFRVQFASRMIRTSTDSEEGDKAPLSPTWEFQTSRRSSLSMTATYFQARPFAC